MEKENSMMGLIRKINQVMGPKNGMFSLRMTLWKMRKPVCVYPLEEWRKRKMGKENSMMGPLRKINHGMGLRNEIFSL